MVSSTNKVGTSINPANKDEVVGYVQQSNKEDVNQAVEVDKRAQVQWRKLSGTARGEYLYKIVNELVERIDISLRQ